MNYLKYGNLEKDPSKLSESVNVKMPVVKENVNKLTESDSGNEYLLPRIEAIHTGRTRNYTHYTGEKLLGDESLGSGVYSWMNPYPKPVIYEHNTYTEATGRISKAAYAEYTQAGRPGIILVPKITEPNAVKALKDGRLLTVSIGATSDAAICSICGTNIVEEGYCGHMKGETYEGRTAEWIVGNLWFDELSWVNVPADSDAMVVDQQTSLFVDMQNESGNGSPLTESTNSKPMTLAEKWGVPEKTKLIVIGESKNKINRQEEKTEMDKDELEKNIKEDDAKTKDVKVEAEVEKDEAEKADSEKDTIETKTDSEGTTPEGKEEETKEKETDEKETDDEVKPEEKEQNTQESLEILKLQATTTSLISQVESLKKEIKNLYVEKIIEKSNVKDDKKEAFTEKMQMRTIESLKDTLEDIEENFQENKKVEEKEEKRTVTKVASPITKNEESQTKESKVATEEDKINFYKSLLKK